MGSRDGSDLGDVGAADDNEIGAERADDAARSSSTASRNGDQGAADEANDICSFCPTEMPRRVSVGRHGLNARKLGPVLPLSRLVRRFRARRRRTKGEHGENVVQYINEQFQDRALRCATCNDAHAQLPSDLVHGGEDSRTIALLVFALHWGAWAGHWYVAACFLKGGAVGARSSIKLAREFLFAPSHGLVSSLPKVRTVRGLATAALLVPFLPAYVQLATRTSVFVVVAGGIIGGVQETLLGIRRPLRACKSLVGMLARSSRRSPSVAPAG